MLHGTTSGIVVAFVVTALCSGPALAKTKLPDEALRQSCISAFGDRDHFDWVPRMGITNALSVCQSALARFPDDPQVQLYHAISRDQLADRGGDQADNLFATQVYRRLAADGVPLAEYALGTMFDESSGVSTEDGLAYMTRARAGEFGESIRCEALRTFGLADLEGSGPSYDVAAAASMAHGNYVCAGFLTGMFWSGYAMPDDLPLPVEDYARYAAVHGDPVAMAMVGLFYAYGAGSTELEPQLQGQSAARQDAERAGYWLLLAHWGTTSSWRPERHAEFWEQDHLLSPVVVEAMQTALTALGYYDGDIDGNFLPSTQEALTTFEELDLDGTFQLVRTKEKYNLALGAREAMHIGPAAMTVGD